MNLAVFGASGPTGLQVVSQALAANHALTAVVRRPDAFPIRHAQLTVVAGDVLKPGRWRDALKGQDAVLSALGIGQKTGATTVYSEGGRNIIEAMRRYGVKRFVGLGSATVENDDPAIPFFFKYVIKPLFLEKAYADIRQFEAYLQTVRDVEWVFIRPTQLINQPRTGVYRVSPGFAPAGGGKIARADVADFMLRQLHDDTYRFGTLTLAY